MSRTSAITINSHEQTECIGRTHPLRRAGFAAIVFSGHRAALSELAGEATAYTPLKFVLEDPTLDEQHDFARSSGITLPRWPKSDTGPIHGLCFVFTSADHPAIRIIREAGGEIGEHFITTSGLSSESDSSDLTERLARFIDALSDNPRIAIIGFGQQGQRIARSLVDFCGVAIERIVVWDSNPNSAALATAMGLHITEDDRKCIECDGVIASPLSRYERISSILDHARRSGIAVFDNAQQPSGLSAWRQKGDVLLDEAANRTLQVDAGLLLSCRDERLSQLTTAHVIREEQRTLAGMPMPHLHSGQTIPLTSTPNICLAKRWSSDGLAEETWGGLTRALISLRDRAEFGFFAARRFCLERWPYATREIMPAEHPIDLGATSFERLLQAHLDAREVVSTMQTPLQRVTLGVVAAHHASDRPIIEIGSALGGSALHLAAATSQRRPPIISVDPDASTREIMRFAMHRGGHVDRLQQIVKTSDAAISELRHMTEACGLVFIDGLHTAEAVRNDYCNYAPLVAIGGVLAFHDVCPALHSVMQAVVEDVLPDRRFLARCLVDGLLVLERVG